MSLLDVDLPDEWAVEVTREFVIVEETRFAKSEFRCKDCVSMNVTVDYVDQQRTEGVDVIAVGATCDKCGSTALHVGY